MAQYVAIGRYTICRRGKSVGTRYSCPITKLGQYRKRKWIVDDVMMARPSRETVING